MSRHADARWGRGRRRAIPYWQTLTALFLSAFGLLVPTAVQAEIVIPTQATADDGAFLPYAPPPAQLGGLCLVDSGVNLNPDTESIVSERSAIDGGSGNDTSPTLHGTVLAMMAAAPANGWGMVGTAPRSIRIISVRILQPGQTTFPFSSYAAGITACLNVRQRDDVRVINLSLGNSETASSGGYEALANAVERANDYGVAVVAAAGNDDGGPVEYPAAYPKVLSVGASDTQTGSFCSFSNRGEGLRLIAPGCDLDGADPTSGEPDYNYWQGTSESSVITAAALTALESYRPELYPQTAEEYLSGAHDSTLDIAQAFRDAGLGQIVAEGEAAEPAPTPTQSATPEKPPQTVPPSSPMITITPFQRPLARLKHTNGRVVLELTGRPGEARAEVRYLGHRRHARRLSVLRTVTGTFTSLTLPTSGVIELSVRYTDPYDTERASPWTTLKLPTMFHARKTRRHT
jgi:hypothetical protein